MDGAGGVDPIAWARRSVAFRVACACLAFLESGCDVGGVRSTFASAPDAGPDAGGAASLDGAVAPPVEGPDSGVGDPGEWGGPCSDDGLCDDHIACTADSCDPVLRRCHFASDDGACDDGAYCDGVERCVAGIGCRPGQPVACSDGTACTIDACVESTRTCTHVPRDADSDGDPDGNCPGGADCNDQSPDVSSLHAEVCGNGIDDDCDGQVDEDDCVGPSYDVCASPLEVRASGTYPLSSVAAKGDYSATCLGKDTHYRDLVVALFVPDGAPADVDVVVTTTSGAVALAAVTNCGDASTEYACATGAVAPGSTRVARTVLRGLAAGAHALYVFAERGGSLTLSVDFLTPGSPPANETCGTSLPLEEDVPTLARLPDTTPDVPTDCGSAFGELVYDFTLDAPRDVRVFASSQDLYGVPILSLRDSSCSKLEDELTCSDGERAFVFRRALPAGRYFASVGATGPSDVLVTLETSEPTTAPADETCSGAPALTPNRTQEVPLDGHEDDLSLGCLPGAVDAAYALTLGAVSDVLLVESISPGDLGAVSLAAPECARGQPLLACASSGTSPLRAIAKGVDAGDYRVVVESAEGSPVSVTALVRDHAPDTVVPFADACDGAAAIPPSGGFFQGNTSNSVDDFTASCDVGGASGSPDQILSLHLERASRVVLDAGGSDYAVIVDVRGGATCPGDEVPFGCSAGYDRGRSYLDLTLPAGDYWVQIDGYSESSGAWNLAAFVAPG